MAEKNLYDLVVDELIERQRLVKSELRKRFKKTNPFRMEKVSPDEALYKYEHLTPQDMFNRIQNEGEEATNQYIKEMKQLQLKQGRGIKSA